MQTLKTILLVIVFVNSAQCESSSLPSMELQKSTLFGDHSTKLMLERIVVPIVRFEKTKLSEALDFTRSIIRDYLQQTQEADLDVPLLVEAKEFHDKPISITQRNLNVLQLVESIAKEAGMKYKISEGKILFEPLPSHSSNTTRPEP